jgi:hypothetical protein
MAAGMKKQPTAPTASMAHWKVALLLSALFLFRLWFGLFSDTWYQIQIFILGLKYYSTGLWPYFGPSVAQNIQLPGALQALLVALPLKVWPAPEAPLVLLAVLSFLGIALLAWYFSKRLPFFPPWIIWGWLLTAPWTLDWSTQLDNDSYILFGSALFFVGFLETLPAFSLNIVSLPLANFMTGFAFFWCAQLHMSFVLLVPFVLASFFFQWKNQGLKGLLPALLFSFLGSALIGSLLVPTFVQYGISQGLGRTNHSVELNISNLESFFTLLARYLSLACCEIARYAGANKTERLAFMAAYPWAAPFTVAAFLLGIIQTLVLLLGWFRKLNLSKKLKDQLPFLKLLSWLEKDHPKKDWPAVKYLALMTFFLIYLSFLFSIKPPAAHTFYITLPVVMLYAFYVFAPWGSGKPFQRLVLVLLFCNIIFHTALALSFQHTRSIYKDRDLFIRAIAEKNYHLLGERREDTIY